jgi:hypothetical protein
VSNVIFDISISNNILCDLLEQYGHNRAEVFGRLKTNGLQEYVVVVVI